MKLEFEITSGKVCLSDPCYSREDVDCGKFDVPAKNGTWIAEVCVEHNGGWGDAVSAVTCIHQDSFIPMFSGLEFGFGVDSGQFGIFDSSIWEDESAWDDENKTFYGKCCNMTCHTKERLGVIDGKGFVSSTGFGDGCYNGFMELDSDGNLIGFRIVFIDPNGEEEDWDEDDDEE